jgi:hypothetical protein
MGFIVFRKANMAFNSASVILLTLATGMGGIIGLESGRPLSKPCLKQVINCSSDQLPSPVESGVRLAA